MTCIGYRIVQYRVRYNFNSILLLYFYFSIVICYHTYFVLCIIEQSKLNLTNKDLQSLGSDYESIHEAEIDAAPSAANATTVEAAATNEDAFDGYSALTNRVVTVQEPPVYCALEISRSQVVVLPDEAFKTNPIYANIVQR